MKHTNTSLPTAPDADWYLLGELELPAGTAAESAIQAWIGPLLEPLHLSADFLSRVLNSIQESVLRCGNPDAGEIPGHIHFCIHAPRKERARGGTWGFFHIERIENQDEEMTGTNHAIDFYLYVEGE